MAIRRTIGAPRAALRTGALLFVLILFLAPTGALAVSIDGTSNTYLLSRETADASKLLPLYEYLDLSVKNVGMESISVHLGGWLRYDLRDDSFGKDKNSDLQYGYVSYRTRTNNAVVNLGRVMVFEGVAAERVDGIYARTDIQGGFGLSAYGGAPVMTNEGDDSGSNTIYGARIAHQKDGLYTIGISYLQQEKNSNSFRKEEGIDLWVRPASKVEIAGRSAYNAETSGWMEHSYYLMLGPFNKVRANIEASWINYADYFAATTNNAFKLTPGGPLDPKEKVNILGPEVFYAVNDNWSVSADYKTYGYDIAGSASYYGIKAAYRMPKSYSAGISLHKMDGDRDRLKYDQYRVYAAKQMGKMDVAVDLLDVKYKVPINNVSNSYSATLAAGYELKESLKIGADAEYSKNPDFDKDVRLFLKLVYRFDEELGRRKGGVE